MSYRVTKADGKSVVIKDFSKEIIGGLTMVGYGFTNYGDEIAQNFVKELENNAGATEPSNPVLGQFWFQIPADSTLNKNIRICISTSASTLETRWKILFGINPSGDIFLDAWTLRGMSPAQSAGGSTTQGQPVVLGPGGKIHGDYLPAQTNQTSVETANRLRDSHVFGSRNGGLSFNGTQDVSLTTSHIAEGDQAYFTTSRARSSFSAGAYISIDANGVIAYTGQSGGGTAGVTSFNSRGGQVTLTSGDVTGALNFTPYGNSGGLISGPVQIQDANFSLSTSGDNRVINFNPNCYQSYERGTGIHRLVTNNQEVLRVGVGDDDLYHNGKRIWSQGYQGPNTGMDADMVDGHHASDFLLTSSFGNLLDVNGYQRLPNGLIMQWGQFYWPNTDGPAFYTYPIAYPTSSFNVWLSILGNPNPSNDRNEEDDEQIWANVYSNSQFVVYDTGDDNAGYSVAWFSLGY